MSKRLSLALLLLTLSPVAARADDASKSAKIQQLLAITKVDHLMDQMRDQILGQMTGMMKQQTAGANLNTGQQKLVSDYTAKVDTMVKTQLAWDKVKAQFTTLYADAYTEPEIDGMLAFYRSPVGQTMLAKLPEINTKGFQIGQGQITPLIPQLRQMSQQFSHEMTAAATKPAPAASPAPTPSSSTPTTHP